MKICSWDVGVKNMPYIIMDVDKENNTFKIIEWNIVSLIDEPLKCCGKLKQTKKALEKNGEKICGKKACFKYSNNDVEYGYCKTHKSQYDENSILSQYRKEINNDNSCSIKLKKQCMKECVVNYNDDNYCAVHKKHIETKMLKNHKLRSFKEKKCDDYDIFELCHNLVTRLDLIPNLLDVDKVYIENQPSKKNPHVKTISAFLYNYFIVRGVVDKDRVKLVKFVSPSNKLKYNVKRTKEVLSKAKTDREKYDLTKELGEEYTLEILNKLKYNKWIKYLNEHGKKDDLCDALLQGYYCSFLSKS